MQQPHRGRRTIRLPFYDYDHYGAYFVTINVQDKEHLFGRIEKGELISSSYGGFVLSKWRDLRRTFRFTRPDVCVAMPDHFHGILFLDKEDYIENVDINRRYNHHGTTSGSLSSIIQNFKSVTTRKINQRRRTSGARIWQRNYYERVIRDEGELNAYRDYIEENPMRWYLKYGDSPPLQGDAFCGIPEP